ncbi:MAG: ferrochelatase [Anaerolineae bacterium]
MSNGEIRNPKSEIRNPKYAVLLMAYGGPDSLDDIEEYLLDIRGGQKTPEELVEEIKERYAQIGGKSPLLDITRAQAKALEERLNEHSDGRNYRVYVGMRHWYPYIEEAVAHIVEDGLHRVVALCMAPHFSRMSIGAYIRKAEEAQKELGVELDVTYIESWHDHPLFLQAIADKVKAALKKFPPEARDDVIVVFTAHSLPAAIPSTTLRQSSGQGSGHRLEQGDPYDRQLRETAAGVAKLLSDIDWQFSYQSSGASSAKWLGPQIEDVVVELAEAGHKNILVAPIGFVADHVEVLYDIDIEARGYAEQAGARLERTDSMNVTPAFIEALADVVRQHTPVNSDQ